VICLRFAFLLAAGLRLSRREEAWKKAEILILRHQLTALQHHQPCRPKLTWADRQERRNRPRTAADRAHLVRVPAFSQWIGRQARNLRMEP
jgi:hypothetical protein